MIYSLDGKRVWVAGHRGMVGSALLRRLETEPCEVLTVGRQDLDLRNQAAVTGWLQDRRPDAIIVAAARVGGIRANMDAPAEFMHDNLMIAANIIHAAHLTDVERLLYIASAAVYPEHAPQPFREDSLMSGPLDPSHEPYAMAKLAGIKLCQAYRRQYGCDFVAALPTNLYGPGDNFDPRSSHVVPALIRKFHNARLTGSADVTLWGNGTASREFLHADDLADALVFILAHHSGAAPINVGSGHEIPIRALAETVALAVGCEAEIRFDGNGPDGVSRRALDSGVLRQLGWTAGRSLADGIRETYAWFCANEPDNAVTKGRTG